MKAIVNIIILCICLLLIVGADQTAIQGQSNSCVSAATNAKLYHWSYFGFYGDDAGVIIGSDQWQQFNAINGGNIWQGYEAGGWDVPGDVRGAYKVIGEINDERMEVWIWYSASTRQYFIFAFDNMRPSYGIPGEYYGIHPCYNGQVENSLELSNWIADVMDNAGLD